MTNKSSSATKEQQETRAKGAHPSAATSEPDSAIPFSGQVRLSEAADVIDAETAVRAYQCWQERGCPEGSPEVDWHRAEQDLRAEKTASREESQSKAAGATSS